MKLFKIKKSTDKEFLSADTVNLWQSLPCEKRLVFGLFYRTPFALECREWSKWKKYIKKEFPIQYFFRELVCREIGFYWRWYVKEPIYYLKCKFWKKYNIIKLGNDPRYKSPNWLLEESIKYCLFLWVEKEDAFNFINWDSDDYHKEAYKDLKQAYDFFKIVLPKMQKESDELLHKLYGRKDGEDFFDGLNKEVSAEEQKERDRLNKMDEMIEQAITDHLILIVRRRSFLWT